MILTNRHNLPAAIVNAIANDPYTKGDADFSVTQLLQPPQISHLLEKHADEVTEDASDRVFSLLGQIVHGIFERAGDTVENMVETTLYTTIDNDKLKGTVDNVAIIDGTLSDFKVTSVYKITKTVGIPSEWVQQTNIYRWMLEREKGVAIKAINIHALLRDWSKREARRNPDYPAVQVATLPVPLWDAATTEQFVRDRIALHKNSANTPCSDEDIWATPSKWAVMKRGGQRAIRLLDSNEAALQYIVNNNVVGGYVEYRPGAAIRCEDYCPVSSFCAQWANDPRNKTPQMFRNLGT